ncbi:dTDP-4-amino-4,6-dideoxygalactose transaminase [Rickettsiales bacterium LUAb2]
MIPFSLATKGKESLSYVKEAIENRKIAGDAAFTSKCHQWFWERFGVKNLLTTSCTHSLEMSAFLCNIKENDEVIMSPYTHSSTANAFIIRGAKVVFIDINPNTMNMDETLIENALTNKTKAIVPVHYAGVGCEMDTIMQLAKKHNCYVVEDAAQAMMAEYKGKLLGSIGDLGCFSFHGTKNYTMGEGGLLLINDKSFIEKAEVLRDSGTDKQKFLHGEVDHYSWVDKGSSYLPSDLNAAYLYAQLIEAEEINNERLDNWAAYYTRLLYLQQKGFIELTKIPDYCKHNAHMFYIKLDSIKVRDHLIKFLKNKEIASAFHYTPLHNTQAGKQYTRFSGEDKYTTKESQRLLRLPMYQGISKDNVSYVCDAIFKFFN